MPEAEHPVPADRALAEWLAAVRSTPTSAREVGARALRAAGRERARHRAPGPELESVADERVAGGPVVRRYRPGGPCRAASIVFVHGGGWVLGDLETHDRLCRLLAAGTGACLTAVDYRRGPEHPWPAAVEDVIAVVRSEHVRQGGEHPMLLAGDSAGGTIATLACLGLARGGPARPSALSLVCPNADLSLGYPSVKTFGRGWGLDEDALRWFVEQWLPDREMRRRGDVSPLYAEDLAELPSTHITTAELDPLGDEGRALADRLREAGVLASHHDEAGLVHGFVTLDHVSGAAAAATQRWIDETAKLIPAAECGADSLPTIRVSWRAVTLPRFRGS
jgi:acetyl esterase